MLWIFFFETASLVIWNSGEDRKDLGKLKIGENVPEMFSSDLNLEMTNQSCLKE